MENFPNHLICDADLLQATKKRILTLSKEELEELIKAIEEGKICSRRDEN